MWRRSSAGPVSVQRARHSTCGCTAKRCSHMLASRVCSIASHPRRVLPRKVVHRDLGLAELNEGFAASKQVHCVASSHTRPQRCWVPQGARVTRASPAHRSGSAAFGALSRHNSPLMYAVYTTAAGGGSNSEPADALPHPPRPCSAAKRSRGGERAAQRRARGALLHQSCTATKCASGPTQPHTQNV